MDGQRWAIRYEWYNPLELTPATKWTSSGAQMAEKERIQKIESTDRARNEVLRKNLGATHQLLRVYRPEIQHVQLHRQMYVDRCGRGSAQR